MIQQGIEQSSAAIASSRMHNQTNRLVDHDDHVVFMDKVKGNRFGLPIMCGFHLCLQSELFASQQLVPGLCRAVIHT